MDEERYKRVCPQMTQIDADELNQQNVLSVFFIGAYLRLSADEYLSFFSVPRSTVVVHTGLCHSYAISRQTTVKQFSLRDG